MATLSLQPHYSPLQFRRFRLSNYHLKVVPRFSRQFYGKKVRFLSTSRGNVIVRGRDGVLSISCFSKTNAEIEKVSSEEKKDEERPPLDINLAVILAGFAFEAYTSPPENIGRREIDAADCKTVYLSESFVREIYDGQLFIKLKKGFDFPAMDPWGTSDPYVVMQLDGQVVKSKTKWGTKEPKWNEDLTFNIKLPPLKYIQILISTVKLQVAAWDANLVTPHKRMGNAGISLESLCDGNLHEVLVELEGMGGGGKLQLEVKYKSFDEIEEEKMWWKVPFVTEFLQRNGFESALKMFVGTETVPARQFVEYAFGQLKSFNDAYFLKERLLNGNKNGAEGVGTSNDFAVSGMSLHVESSSETSIIDTGTNNENNSEKFHLDNVGMADGQSTEPVAQVGEIMQFDKYFWKNFADVINQNVVHKLGVPVPEKLKWDGFDLLNKIGLQSRKIAEAKYIESGLATPDNQDIEGDKVLESGFANPEDQENKNDKAIGPLTISSIQSSLPDIKKATEDVLRQTDSVLGALMVLTAAVSQSKREGQENETKEDSSAGVENNVSRYSGGENVSSSLDGSVLDEKKAEEMKELFATAESAMEAWAMLATSLGHPSFIKSEFEKICFLDNATTDTQVAIWRDSARRQIVIAFRGTEQARWKDLRTDLMLVPAGLNPERIDGDFKQEVQVHSGFLSAYDSVRIRIISLLKTSIRYIDETTKPLRRWQVYVTGHSLGGALATLLALELSSSQLAKHGAISVTMYNFGSPRVGNRRFAEVYNEKVKDSWRIVNHRDIIPTVPRLMGYCHVAQPVYLAAGELRDALENMELWKDGYQGDVIGEYTPDVLVTEFMKGERELIEQILQTEINIFRAIRDGSALMQHMEDFYYITLLESVRSNYQTVASSRNNEQGSMSTS
ncbi:Triglyceride lipases,triglyceride lipases isoform 1 [Theobroma cacao]|uniref:Triglyceride lipases,triglyceride lipases isoform 1 n=1 Tax=Theobroma cacao TaxID=3641 RepID=A0A061ET47_THECC|nr:Triglyceride lipases,triglyceride lipases isoform 1 [Theobroma cacao]